MVFEVGLFHFGVGRFIDEWYGIPELLFDGLVIGEAYQSPFVTAYLLKLGVRFYLALTWIIE